MKKDSDWTCGLQAIRNSLPAEKEKASIKKNVGGNPAMAAPVRKDGPGLRVGQQVVMMDSDLRGRVISIGKKIGIMLEDGMSIEASYGEFVPTEASEEEKLIHTCPSSGKEMAARRSSRKPVSGNLVVDLHISALPGGGSIPEGQQLSFQLEVFRRIMKDNIRHRGMKITFIHGIGDGILKKCIRDELDGKYALSCTYNAGKPGTTVVTVR